MYLKCSLLTICFYILFIKINGQNVGIGTLAPAEKLDVNGNIKLSGDLKIKNSQGLPGQMLSRASDNTLTWAYTNNNFNNNYPVTDGIGTFTVPAGVTSLMAQIWGAGGAASGLDLAFQGNRMLGGCGGGGGGFLQVLLKVTPGQSISYHVGHGGGIYQQSEAVLHSYVLYGQAGEASNITINGRQLIANGGSGANGIVNSSFLSAVNIVGEGGGYSGPDAADTSILNYYGMRGKNGGNVIFMTDYTSAGVINQIQYGYGGDGANTVNTGGTGAFSGSFPDLQYSTKFIAAKQPGGGGPAMGANEMNALLQTASREASGANGMIVFWW